MKIAIKGEFSRGKEVLEILESLGENIYGLYCDSTDFYYYITDNNTINYVEYKEVDSLRKKGYTIFTLDTFNSTFSHKIGEIAMTTSSKLVTITGYNTLSDTAYYKVKYNNGETALISEASLIFNKEIINRNVRTLEIPINQAKEWYNKGGDLKELALKVFTEKELAYLPKTWEEFLRGFDYRSVAERAVERVLSSLPHKYCNKYAALLKLNYLMDYYRKDWKPNWKDNSQNFCIKMCNPLLSVARFRVYPQIHTECFFAFQSKEVAEEFLKNFEPLMVEAGDLVA